MVSSTSRAVVRRAARHAGPRAAARAAEPATDQRSSERSDWKDELPTTCIDVSAQVDRKVAAIAAQRSQFPIQPDLFPRSMLQEMLGREYFVRIRPPRELETEL